MSARNSYPWIADFLSNREQCVKLGPNTSEWLATTCGLAHGTKLGPVVFLAMVNEAATETDRRWKYVDDITVAESCNSRSTTPTTGLQDTMDVISTRSAADHMTVNVGKCMVMQCSFGKRVPPPPQVSANGNTVPIVNKQHDTDGDHAVPFP